MDRPPKFAVRLLAKICPAYLWEGIAGDLEEQFYEDSAAFGQRTARWKYTWNALRFIRPGILLRNKFKLNNNTIMISNYLKTAGRSMAKRKLFTFINAFGLSIGLAFCMLIYLFIQDEYSFDTFHKNASDIYRVEEYAYRTFDPNPENPYLESAYLQTALAPTLKEELAEVKYATRFNGNWDQVVKKDSKIFTENIAFTDNDFFKIFSFEVLSGNEDKFLQSPEDLVITQTIAEKYFGATDPLNQTMVIDIMGEKTFQVVGVVADPPANSSFDFDFLIPQVNRPFYERSMERWGNFNTPTFVQLQSGATKSSFEKSLLKIRDKYMKESLERDREEFDIPEDAVLFEYRTTNLLDMHMKSEVNWHKVSDSQYTLILGGLAILIIIIASINYVSLALTASTARGKEVGVRKTIGANRLQLVFQYAFESVLLAMISLVLGVLLMAAFLPAFNDFTGKSIELEVVTLMELLGVGVLIAIGVGFIAGSYPSLFLSSFRPATVLKAGSSTKVRAGLTRPLVLLQFTLASVLIISSFVMYEQMEYVTTKDLGFEKEQLLVVPTQYGWTEESDQAVDRMRNALLNEADVKVVAGTSSSFSKGWSRYGYKIDGENKAAYVWSVDPYYLDALGIELKEGRNFDAANPSDTLAVIINESLAADMKWENPLDEYLNWREDSIGPGYKVIGVLKDYHFLSLQREIEPLFLSINKEEVGHLTTMLVKLDSKDIGASLSKVESIFKTTFPDKPFDYSFLDEDINQQYESSTRWMNIMGVATIFALFISGLGLFGIAGINAVNKTKEIGIRKVFGAPLSAIFMLLNRQYLFMAVASFVIAAPLAWYLMNNWWLSDFQFKIEMGPELYLTAFAIALIVALFTVSYHGIRAAYLNPSDTLRHE